MGRDFPALTGIAALRYTYQRAISSLAKGAGMLNSRQPVRSFYDAKV
jgi:hypothetical protein